MSRAQSPERKKALKIWEKSGRTKKPAEIAAELGISAQLVRKWKSIDQWEEKPTPRQRGPGAPTGNKNAKGNKGGPGGPLRNAKAVTHGLYRKFLPNDKETLEIFDVTDSMEPLDLLWASIRILWTNIIRAQKIMFVRDQDDMTKELKKEKNVHFGGEEGGGSEETEYEIQFAWDKQGAALTAQSSAMSRLTSMIKQYEDMLRTLPPEEILEEQRLRIEKLKLEIGDLKGEGNDIAHQQGNSYEAALNAQAADVFADED
ncbi:phage terminase small subunit [Paenibacillus sp. YYML68]|uniref:phage terminase small subunit n=1 Tax=Paenibacillus sp. YYML68 TaxID=2909250 RepID=UPI0024924DDD|nr:phage terminase small subunit [Paenibacillus sp. YYML68]